MRYAPICGSKSDADGLRGCVNERKQRHGRHECHYNQPFHVVFAQRDTLFLSIESIQETYDDMNAQQV